jgi:hypothetical protein
MMTDAIFLYMTKYDPLANAIHLFLRISKLFNESESKRFLMRFLEKQIKKTEASSLFLVKLH